MDKRSLTERDICTKFILPAIKRAGSDEMVQVREEVYFTKGRIIVRGKLVTRGKAKKAEVIRRRGPWRSLDAVKLATLEWLDWFNQRRLLEPIGNTPPAEAEARYYAQLEERAMAA